MSAVFADFFQEFLTFGLRQQKIMLRFYTSALCAVSYFTDHCGEGSIIWFASQQINCTPRSLKKFFKSPFNVISLIRFQLQINSAKHIQF